MISHTVKRDYWPTREWQAADPVSAGTVTEKLAGLEQMVKAQHKNINGIVVVKNGYVVFERYYNGYGPHDAHNLASVTKSVMSALIGIAIDAGYIRSVDQKVLEFFPEYVPPPGHLIKRTITLGHLLTMTAPFAWKAPGIGGLEPLDRLRRQRDWVPYILGLLGGEKELPGRFQYYTVGTHLLSAIITRTTGMCAREFANERLFRPLGMREIPDRKVRSFSLEEVFGGVTGWVSDPGGNTVGGWGLPMTPRDMARFGFLYVNHGTWDGRQIISEKWIAESTAPNANKYGYLWWLREAGGLYAYSALGSGGNVICCIPEKDLVVAIASEIVRKPLDRWPLLEKYILPAVL